MYDERAVRKYSKSAKGRAAKRRVDKKRSRRRILLKQYGLTPEAYNSMLIAQDNKCASCKEPERRLYKGRIHYLSVDHDHETDAIRGLLCYGCNSALGFLHDKSEYVAKLLVFIRAHEARQEV